VFEIKTPKKEDLQDLLLLLLKFREEYKDIFPEVDMVKVAQIIEQHFNNGFISNAYVNNKLVGSIGALKTEWWFSKKQFVAETWFYVLPQHRSYKLAKFLIRELKKYSNNMTIQLPVSSGNDNDKLYKKFEFKKMGSIWRYK
tara:strand:- start:300 stop:725 length:426 start_codon:yes stop_codon:yes gene_type:complete